MVVFLSTYHTSIKRKSWDNEQPEQFSRIPFNDSKYYYAIILTSSNHLKVTIHATNDRK